MSKNVKAVNIVSNATPALPYEPDDGPLTEQEMDALRAWIPQPQPNEEPIDSL